MSGECEKCWEHCLDCECSKVKYRRYRRMTEEEQKTTGYPSESESIRDGLSPISISLGFDPFITFDEFESSTPPNYMSK